MRPLFGPAFAFIKWLPLKPKSSLHLNTGDEPVDSRWIKFTNHSSVGTLDMSLLKVCLLVLLSFCCQVGFKNLNGLQKLLHLTETNDYTDFHLRHLSDQRCFFILCNSCSPVCYLWTGIIGLGIIHHYRLGCITISPFRCYHSKWYRFTTEFCGLLLTARVWFLQRQRCCSKSGFWPDVALTVAQSPSPGTRERFLCPLRLHTSNWAGLWSGFVPSDTFPSALEQTTTFKLLWVLHFRVYASPSGLWWTLFWWRLTFPDPFSPSLQHLSTFIQHLLNLSMVFSTLCAFISSSDSLRTVRLLERYFSFPEMAWETF